MKPENKNIEHKGRLSKYVPVEDVGLINIKPDIQKLKSIRTGWKKNIKKN